MREKTANTVFVSVAIAGISLLSAALVTLIHTQSSKERQAWAAYAAYYACSPVQSRYEYPKKKTVWVCHNGDTYTRED